MGKAPLIHCRACGCVSPRASSVFLGGGCVTPLQLRGDNGAWKDGGSKVCVPQTCPTASVRFASSSSPHCRHGFCFLSDPSQPLERLHAGGVHCDWCGWLLVCLHPEPLLQGAHEEDDEGPGRPPPGRAESPRPPGKVSPSLSAGCRVGPGMRSAVSLPLPAPASGLPAPVLLASVWVLLQESWGCAFLGWTKGWKDPAGGGAEEAWLSPCPGCHVDGASRFPTSLLLGN